jgi:MFS family permease
MFERGAYYSMMAIIAIHAHYNLGFTLQQAAILTAFMYPFQYGLPLFSGALAEKVGYKKQIIFAFIFLTLAYVFLSFAYSIPTMILAVMAVGMGIGSYKPLISATVAKATNDADRNVAYGIYYWIVNLAAFAFPFSFALIIMFGIITRPLFFIIFLICAILVSLNIITAIFIFEEVPRSGKVKTISDVVSNIKLALSDKKFVVMVVLIGGFWALYSTMLNALPLIIFGFRWDPWFFNAMLLGTFNPLTIIVLGAFISKYIEKVESMRVILSGLMVYLIGLSFIGFFIQNWSMVVIGIVIVSIGEFMIAPGYLAFISKLASKEKVSAYIGCNFISYMIGLLGGTIVFSFVLDYVAKSLERPNFFYGILISFGLFLLFTFIIYYKSWGQDVIARAKKIRELEEGYVEKVVIDEGYKEPIIFRLFETKVANIIPLILIPIVLVSTFSYGTFHYFGPDVVEEEVIPPFDPVKFDIVDGISQGETGTLQVGGSDLEILTIEPESGNYLESITFILTWRDEPDSTDPRANYQNQPDEFQLSANLGTNYTNTDQAFNPQNGEGSISITFNIEHDLVNSTNGTGDWIIDITLLFCGNQEPSFNPLGLRDINDNSNDYSLMIETKVYTPRSE